MAKWAIIYDSKYGSTEKYARWLQQKLDADLYKMKNVKTENLIGYELLIFAGAIYNDKIAVTDVIKRNIGHLMFKKVVVLANGWYEDNFVNKEWLMDKNFSPEMHGRFPLFLVRGEIDSMKTSLPDKMSLKMQKAQINKRPDRTNDDIVAISMIDGMNKYTAEENLTPLVEFLTGGKNWTAGRKSSL